MMVQIFVSAIKLKNLDTFDASDPLCVVYTRKNADEPWQMMDKTETIDNNLNPVWSKHFDLKFKFL
jgi:hypothetical protein